MLCSGISPSFCRGIFVVLFLLPVSFVYDLYWSLSRFVALQFRSSPSKHDERVQLIQAQVLAAKGHQMCTARPGWLAMSLREGLYKKTLANIRIDLYDILSVDEAARVVRVEPMCSMGQITAELIPRGWTLAVTPELDDLTVGGLIMGFGIETSSHKYGLFQHICAAFEIVLPDGKLVRATQDENQDLFYGIPWSHGSLGFLVAAELEIVPAKGFVKLTYYPARTLEKCVALLEMFSQQTDKYEYVEGLMFSADESVILTGELTDACDPNRLNAIGKYWKPWFYKHVESYLRRPARLPEVEFVEYIPLRQYYHRHARSIFWEMKDIIPFGNHVVFRWLLGWLIPPHISLLKLTQTEALRKMYEEHHVVQDMLVPVKQLADAIRVFHREYNLYPLWLCPMKLPQENPKYPGLVRSPSGQDELYVDIGAYGNPAAKAFQARECGRRVEQFVMSIKGYQALYADTFMTRDEFRHMFNHTLHDQLRDRYQCRASLPEIYDKISRAARK